MRDFDYTGWTTGKRSDASVARNTIDSMEDLEVRLLCLANETT